MHVPITKGSDGWNFMTDYYKFIQDYAEPEDSDEFWENMLTAGQALSEKYQTDKEFHDALIWAHMQKVERIAKQTLRSEENE